MMEAVSGLKEVHNAMCQNRTEENKRRYKSMKNKANKAVSMVMVSMVRLKRHSLNYKNSLMACLGW